MVKNLDLMVYYNFGAEGAFFVSKAFFLVNFGAFRRFLKRRKTAEDVINYQFWRRSRFLLSKEFCKDNLYYTVGYV